LPVRNERAIAWIAVFLTVTSGTVPPSGSPPPM
jgi:hypothetical protein